jgi:hypothetical protein
MSGSDGEGQLSGRGVGRKRREAWFWVALLAVVLLVVVVASMIAGLLDPYSKRAILKAEEMGDLTGLRGEWEQTSLHSFEANDTLPFSSREAAYSTIYFHNRTTNLSVAITVAELKTDHLAKLAFNDLNDTWSLSGDDTVAVDIGEEGILCGDLGADGTCHGPAHIQFRKGAFIVAMTFCGGIDRVEMFEDIARGQAARL